MTKYKLADALKENMKYKSLEKITIGDIVNVAHVTRQTFYRHFQDKYDLLNWYFEKLVESSFEKMGVSITLEEGLIKKFQFIKEEKHFFTAAFTCKDAESMMQFDYTCIYAFYTNIIKRHATYDEAMDFLLQMYCRGSIDMTVQWVRDGMKMAVEHIVSLLIEGIPPKLKPYLEFHKKDVL